MRLLNKHTEENLWRLQLNYSNSSEESDGDSVAMPSPSIIVINIIAINYNLMINKLITLISRFSVTGGSHEATLIIFYLWNLIKKKTTSILCSTTRVHP